MPTKTSADDEGVATAPTAVSDLTKTDAASAGSAGDSLNQAPDHIGRYEIVGLLGQGGMGAVYRARDPDLGRELAIKVLHTTADERTSSAELEKRLLREAQSMARLSHPNIATVYDVGTFRGRVFVAMEYVAGDTLKGWLAAAHRPWRERLDVVCAAGHGLAEAHTAGVVHRDFKPDNVLVQHSGKVKVVDFGLARSLGDIDLEERDDDALDTESDRDVKLTRTGAIMGTPAYMSPEQHLGQPIDERSDQFSFGIVLYEALWGTRPYEGRTSKELVGAMMHAGPARPAAGEVPDALVAVVFRALAVEPDQRFASMEQLLTSLERAARPVQPTASKTGRALALAAAVAALAVGGAATYKLTQGGDSSAATSGAAVAAIEAPAAPTPSITTESSETTVEVNIGDAPDDDDIMSVYFERFLEAVLEVEDEKHVDMDRLVKLVKMLVEIRLKEAREQASSVGVPEIPVPDVPDPVVPIAPDPPDEP